VAATAVLIFFSRILVDNAVKIAEELSIPASIVGATIVSIGTTLPELTTTIQAFKKKMFDIGLSNAIGSCIVNSTLILGINTLVGFKAINLISVTSLLIFFLAACILLWYFINTERKIKKIEASVLISAYLVFIIQELGLITFIFK
jgi:cation:H+ antiporter